MSHWHSLDITAVVRVAVAAACGASNHPRPPIEPSATVIHEQATTT